MSISVVGGGPAGSSASIFLARKGFDNIKLYERLPNWRKPCGGGLGEDILKRYGNLLKGLDTRSFKSAIMDIEGTVIRLNFKKTILKVVDRLKFDKHLRSIAESEGVEIIKRNVDPYELNDSIIIDARGVRFRKNLAITRLAICKLKNAELTIALRSSLISKGYFWVFPINDELANIGCGGVQHSFKIPINKAFDWFVKRIKAKPLINMGYPLDMDGKIDNILEKNDDRYIIKVGERAGLVSPLNGGGIYCAIRSSEILSECIEKDCIDSYEDKIKREFENRFLISKITLNLIPIVPNFLKVVSMKLLAGRPTFSVFFPSPAV
jgi:flavin-dependent dehydrogenase